MNGKRTLLVASVLEIQDSCFFYPSCQNCFSRLILLSDRCKCLKCCSTFEIKHVNYRYRLPLKVADGTEIFAITVFGSCLEPFFGVTAGFLQRYLDGLKIELEEDGSEAAPFSLLTQAVECCFTGKSFIFGISASGNKVGQCSLSHSVLHTSLSSSKFHKQLIASQIAFPNADILGSTVISYYKQILSSSLRNISSIAQLPGSPLIVTDEASSRLSSSLPDSSQSTFQGHHIHRFSRPWQQSLELTYSSADSTVNEMVSTSKLRKVPINSNAWDEKWSFTQMGRLSYRRSSCRRSSQHVEHPSSDEVNKSRKRRSNCVSWNEFDVLLKHSPSQHCLKHGTKIQHSDLQNELSFKAEVSQPSCQSPKSSIKESGCSNSEMNLTDKHNSCLEEHQDLTLVVKGKHANPNCSEMTGIASQDALMWDELPFSESLGEFITNINTNVKTTTEANFDITKSAKSESVKKLDDSVDPSVGQKPVHDSCKGHTIKECLPSSQDKCTNAGMVLDNFSVQFSKSVKGSYAFDSSNSFSKGLSLPSCLKNVCLLENKIDSSCNKDASLICNEGGAVSNDTDHRKGYVNISGIQKKKTEGSHFLTCYCSETDHNPIFCPLKSMLRNNCDKKTQELGKSACKQLPEQKSSSEEFTKINSPEECDTVILSNCEEKLGEMCDHTVVNKQIPLLNVSGHSEDLYSGSFDLFDECETSSFVDCVQNTPAVLSSQPFNSKRYIFKLLQKPTCDADQKTASNPYLSSLTLNLQTPTKQRVSLHEKDIQSDSELDLTDSQDFVPYSQSTPVIARPLTGLMYSQFCKCGNSKMPDVDYHNTKLGQASLLLKNNQLKHHYLRLKKSSSLVSKNDDFVKVDAYISDLNNTDTMLLDSDTEECVPPSTRKLPGQKHTFLKMNNPHVKESAIFSSGITFRTEAGIPEHLKISRSNLQDNCVFVNQSIYQKGQATVDNFSGPVCKGNSSDKELISSLSEGKKDAIFNSVIHCKSPEKQQYHLMDSFSPELFAENLSFPRDASFVQRQLF